MNIVRTLLLSALTAVTCLAASNERVQAQVIYGGPIYHPPVIATPPVYPSASVAQSPFDACQCNPSTPGDCKCKNLSCKLKLPGQCKFHKPVKKTPVLCKIYGKIPVINSCSDCLTKLCDFNYPTEVPEIHCIKESCCEIGTKLIQCLPGCCFNVCVPVYTCVTQNVQCKLTPKPMPMQIWQRNQDGQIVYDVYVINTEDPSSAFHAGGMPAKWVVLHCGTEEEVKRRFPGATCSDGRPILPSMTLKKGVTPEATSADVPIKLVVDQAKVQQYLNGLNANKSEQKAEQAGQENTEKAELLVEAS